MPLLSCPESHTEAVEIQKSKKRMEKILKEMLFFKKIKTVYTKKKKIYIYNYFSLILY